MPRPPSGGTPKQGAEKPALGNGRPPFLHLGPDSVHDGLVHGLRVSALHSQANPFIRFLSLGTIKSATSGLLASSSSTCGRFAMVQRMVSTPRCQIFGNRSHPVRPPSGCPLIPLLTPAVPEVWKVASNVPRRASVHRREPRRRGSGQAGRGLQSLALPIARCPRPHSKTGAVLPLPKPPRPLASLAPAPSQHSTPELADPPRWDFVRGRAAA